MTWGIKVQRLAIVFTVIGALALASSANWADWFTWLFCW